MPLPLRDLNAADQESFVGAIGSVFEGSPWIAATAWYNRPFKTVDQLHAALCSVVDAAPVERQLDLIKAHPDLVGKAALAGALTSQSQGEQASAGLDHLSAEEIDNFTRFNARYWEKFGFPFVICARENKKESILRSFAERLPHARDQEIHTALGEIAKIARLRLLDALTDGE